jgi:hypothetical protein
VILSEGLSRYREFSAERSQLRGLARIRQSATDLVTAFRAAIRLR